MPVIVTDVDDSALVAAMAGKDPAGLDGAYRRYADSLYAYARSLTGDRHAAADIVHDTFLLASQHAGQLRDPSRLRPWLYAIARNEGMRQARRQSKHAPLEAAPDIAADTIDMASAVRSAEIAELVRSAMAGLSGGDREVAELAIRHQMAVNEIAAVLDVPVNHAHAKLSRAREQLVVALGALLVARRHTGECRQLSGLLQAWDGQLNPLLRKRLHRHIDLCPICSDTRSKRLNPAVLLSSYAGLPFVVAPELRRTNLAVPTPKWREDTGFPEQTEVTKRPPSVSAFVAGAIAVILVFGGGAALLSIEPKLVREPAVLPSMTTSPETPSASPSPVATTPSAASPSARPSTGPPGLSFDATATATCVSPSGAYTLTVTAMANANLSSATLTRVGMSTPPQDMTVSGKKAQLTFTANQLNAQITWRVSIRAQDGRSLAGPNQTTKHPCFP